MGADMNRKLPNNAEFRTEWGGGSDWPGCSFRRVGADSVGTAVISRAGTGGQRESSGEWPPRRVGFAGRSGSSG